GHLTRLRSWFRLGGGAIAASTCRRVAAPTPARIGQVESILCSHALSSGVHARQENLSILGSRVEDFWSAQHEGRKFGSLGICESLGSFLVRHRIPFSLDQIAHRVGGFMRGVFRRLFGPFLLFRHFVRLPGYVIFSHGFCSLSAINPYRASPLEMSWGASL